MDVVSEELGHDPTIDITTTGRRTGRPRRIEIWMLDVDGRYFITGTPGRRDWLANLSADPKLWNIAAILHDGVTIKVTARMRWYFEQKHRAGERGWYPLKPTTTSIRIPGRPFFQAPFVTNQKKYMSEYESAVEQTLGGK